MGALEIATISIVIVFGALMLPILFDENPGVFLENSLCVIFTPFNGMNTTCNNIPPHGNVTFIGENGIDVYANNSINTVFWNLTAINSTLIEGSFPCEESAQENDILIFNGTLGEWTCVNIDTFEADVGFDNDDFFYPHLCVGEASDPIVPFTEYKIRAVEYDTGKDCNWQFVAPENVGLFESIRIQAWFYKDKTDAGTACLQMSFLPLMTGDDVDGSFASEKEDCEVLPGGGGSVDVIHVIENTWNATEHTIDENDMVIVKIDRSGDPPDDYNEKIWMLGAKLEWVSSP